VISVITATYNRAETLARALDSLLSQTYPDWECILIDDGSTDETRRVIARYTDSRIRVFHHPVNRGFNAARNTGLDNIGGEWFTFVDSDDELAPEALEVVLEIGESNDAGCVITNALNLETGELTGVGASHEGFLSQEESAALRGDYWGITRTSFLGELRFNERLPGGETALWTRLYARTRRYYIDQALLIVHTQGGDRMSTKNLSLRQKIDMYSVLSEEPEYLDLLREFDPPHYRRIVLRIWAARFLNPIVPRD
jgi:glycosyltransferase involved in cell wall biosynthesis